MKQKLLDVGKKVLPDALIEAYRRRRATRRYLKSLGYEMYERQIRLRLEDVEARMAARRDGFYERLVKEVVDRTELILQELDRRIEGLSARHGNELRSLRDELGALRERLDGLEERGSVKARGDGSQADGALAGDVSHPASLRPLRD